MKRMKNFGNLPYELRMFIFELARKYAFQRKIKKFEELLTHSQGQWKKYIDFQSHLHTSWMFKHRRKDIKYNVIYFSHDSLDGLKLQIRDEYKTLYLHTKKSTSDYWEIYSNY